MSSIDLHGNNLECDGICKVPVGGHDLVEAFNKASCHCTPHTCTTTKFTHHTHTCEREIWSCFTFNTLFTCRKMSQYASTLGITFSDGNKKVLNVIITV